ncbi:hypothetical protein [Paenibacillus sp. FSL R10-2771]|uniref:hypothetical protein n=1 Tax=Paenibacillus sp. FSL R10-2771 TaxID=2954693 RepID=UPI0030FA9CB2
MIIIVNILKAGRSGKLGKLVPDNRSSGNAGLELLSGIAADLYPYFQMKCIEECQTYSPLPSEQISIRFPSGSAIKQIRSPYGSVVLHRKWINIHLPAG